MQVPYYNVHKIMQGLLDQSQLLGNAQAMDVLLKMAKYFFKRISSLITKNGTAVWEAVLGTEAGGMNDVMYKLYALSRDPQHLRMAHLFDKVTKMDGLRESRAHIFVLSRSCKFLPSCSC